MNQAADALSRHTSPPAQLNAVSSSTPVWLAAVVSGYDKDPAATQLIQELLLALDAHPPFSLSNGVLRKKGRI